MGGAVVIGLCIGEREGLLVSTCIGEEGLPDGHCGSVFSDSEHSADRGVLLWDCCH